MILNISVTPVIGMIIYIILRIREVRLVQMIHLTHVIQVTRGKSFYAVACRQGETEEQSHPGARLKGAPKFQLYTGKFF